MHIGIIKVHSNFPYILRYLWPQLLNRITDDVNDDAKVYKWLCWFIIIELPAKRTISAR
jgi:hypothetical protein